MMQKETSTARVAIACGGTGGHLFPGMAVADRLRQRNVAVTLLISPKEVDQQAVKTVPGIKTEVLPAVGLARGSRISFVHGLWQSFRTARRIFKTERPDAVLAMGGFTSAPAVLAGRTLGVPGFLHESNTIPGRANRWLSWFVEKAFVGFPEAGERLHTRNFSVTGTPVRTQFTPGKAAECRAAFGLDANRPVLLVTGGSQGASGLNKLIISTLPFLAKLAPDLQLLHLTGANDTAAVEQACAAVGLKAVVRPFLAEMHLALGAASVAVSRAGASSLAELAAMEVPAILVPYPAATDDHQHSNALAFEKTGAAYLVRQSIADPEALARKIVELVRDAAQSGNMRAALRKWQAPQAAERIASDILEAIASPRETSTRAAVHPPVVQSHQTVSS